MWQDRRTAETCTQLRDRNLEGWVNERTGLLLDPYFTATKLGWLLDHVDGARQRAEQGDLAAGTIDSFLLWRLTGGQMHATDATNASRTLLFNIHSQQWDPDLLALFDIPDAILPEVKNSADDSAVPAPRCSDRPFQSWGLLGINMPRSLAKHASTRA